MNLIQQLVKKGKIEKKLAAVLEYELKISGKTEEELLLEKQVVSESFLFNLKSEYLKIPIKEAIPKKISLKVLELVPEEAIKYYKLIPLSKKDGIVEIGMMHPENLKAKEALNFLSRKGKFDYKIFLITPTVFKSFLKQYKTLRKEVTKALEELETEFKQEDDDEDDTETFVENAAFERIVEEAPITKIVAVLLRHAVEGKASDVHIEPQVDKLRVRFRLDGILHSSIFMPLKIHPAVVSRIKILSNLKIDETRVPQDGRFSARVSKINIDFRVSIFPTVLGEKVVLRILDPCEGIKDFQKLGLIERDVKVLEKATKKTYGMILSTGPTGCGKTTTLYSILTLLNKEGVNIMTLEDPVEYFIKGINQSQVRPDIGYTFATGLRSMVRQDPDVIMVGEIRDGESADLAVNAALTGHIVLSTLHTSNAAGVIPRLADLDVSTFLIQPSLNLILAQRLIRVLCPHCKKEQKPKPEVKKFILEETQALSASAKTKYIKPNFSIFEPEGCKKCNFQGYKGRIAVYELLEVTDRLSEIILKEPTDTRISEEARRQGMITMRQNGIIKLLQGITSLEEILRVTGGK
jgi:type IV pilus assembly protein PilB